MHQPWAHSAAIRAARSTSFKTLELSERLQESLAEASDLEALAGEKGIPIVEPFTGVATPDDGFFVIGPDRDYYEELLGEMPSKATQAAAASLVRKLAEAAQALIPESPYDRDAHRRGENHRSEQQQRHLGSRATKDA